jgi:hypothetical protein
MTSDVSNPTSVALQAQCEDFLRISRHPAYSAVSVCLFL